MVLKVSFFTTEHHGLMSKKEELKNVFWSFCVNSWRPYGYVCSKRQRKAQDAAIQAQMAGFNLAKPYISDMYRGGTDALNAALDARLLRWPNLCWLNQAQQDAIKCMEGTGRAGAADATNFMNLGRGFGQNYGDLYNKPLRICLATPLTMPAPI